MRDYLRRAFGCDVRSLAVFRIALGLLLLADLGWRLPYFDAWLTETGAWPIAATRTENPRAWSLYFQSGSTAWTATLLGSAAAAAVALALGWRTRCATIVSWVLLVSLQARNVLPTNAGDIVLRLLLFWSAFLPLGARWSLDARGKPAGGNTVSVATAAVLIQVALIYVFNGLYKSGEEWRNGTAVATVLSQESYTTALAPWLLEWPRLLCAATHATRWFELLGPALAFLPWKTGLLRGVVALGFMVFHSSLFATLRIGLFPLICIAAWLPFLPAGFWDVFRTSQSHPVLSARSRVVNAVAGLALALVLCANVLRFAEVRRPDFLRAALSCLRLDQQWSLFAPDPSRTEGWLVVVIESSDGREYDGMTGDEIDWSRPEHLGRALPSGQWRKFLSGVRNPRFPERARWFARWRAAEWRRMNPEATVQRARIHFLWEWVAKRQRPPGNWFIFEEPPGPVTEMAKRVGYRAAPPADSSDL